MHAHQVAVVVSTRGGAMVAIVLWAETGARHDYFQLLVFWRHFSASGFG